VNGAILGQGLVGSMVGPCRLAAYVGSGGMGTVYQGRVERKTPGLRLGDRVAVKIFNAPEELPGTHLERFLREAEAGRRISHPNVIRAFEAGRCEVGGTEVHYIVMEFLEGTDLQGLLRELGRFPEHLCRRVGRDIARGLAAVHAAGIVHRDLKPENVLITPDHVVKVADLGIARVSGDLTRLSIAGQFLGTVLYGAPEQFEGRPDAVDARTDLYGLGWVLYQLASGIHPLAGSPMAAIIHSQIHVPPPPLPELAPGTTPFLAALVHALLEKDPAKRPASAEEVAEALDGGEESAWWTARRPAPGPGPEPAPRRAPVSEATAFVGRGAEIARLLALFAGAAKGRGGALLVEGAPGSGRTRLVHEAAARLELGGRDFRFLRGSHPLLRGASFAASFLAALSGALGPAALVEGLLRRLPGASAPSLREMLARGGRGELPRSADGPSLAAACLDLCFALAEERPLLLLIEDLHLVPEAGRRLFLDLAAAAATRGILLVGTVPPGGPAFPGVERVLLPGLDPGDGARLLADLLHGEDLAAPLAPFLSVLTGGNPLFLCEAAHDLQAGGLLGKEPGAVLAALPPDLLGVYRARLSGLSGPEREVLDLAACHGFEFDPPVVAAALGMDPISIMRTLAGIETAHRLVRSSGERWRFEHPLVQEVLLSGIPGSVRLEYDRALLEAERNRDATTAEHTLAAKTASGGPAPRRDRVLVVDDDPQLRDILCQLVEGMGFDATAAENGLSAVAHLRRDPPDLVITDLSMPGLNGREVLSRMKGDPRLRDIPAIVVTANDDVGEAASCIEEGAEDYVLKPYNAILLQARIRASLERRRLRLKERELSRRVEEYALELEQALRGKDTAS
jgi:CheY-like chemotaxis protein